MDMKSQLEKEKMDITLKFEAQINERELKIKSKIFPFLFFKVSPNLLYNNSLRSENKSRLSDLNRTLLNN